MQKGNLEFIHFDSNLDWKKLQQFRFWWDHICDCVPCQGKKVSIPSCCWVERSCWQKLLAHRKMSPWFSLDWFGISRAVAFFKQMSHLLIDRCEIINRRVASRFVLRLMARWMKLIGKTRIRPWMQFSVCQILLEASHSPNVQQNLDTLKKFIATWQQQMAENVQSFTVQEQASGDYIQKR